jgi:hypothetical protein
MRMLIRAGFAVLILLEIATASAQVPTGTARLAGQVSDTAGRGLRGAHVSIQLIQDVRTPSNHRFAPRSTTADSAGRFGFDRLPGGRYAIRSLMIGLARWQDTVQVEAGRSTDVAIRMSEDPTTRWYRENEALNAASWQPILIFTEHDSDVRSCSTNVQAVTLVGDTIVVTGCEVFGHVGPTLRGGVHRYGSAIVLDVVPVESIDIAAMMTARRYRAKILVREPASYVLYVRLNIASRTLDSELVTTRLVDLVRRTIESEGP